MSPTANEGAAAAAADGCCVGLEKICGIVLMCLTLLGWVAASPLLDGRLGQVWMQHHVYHVKLLWLWSSARGQRVQA